MRGTGGNNLETASDRCLIVDPFAAGVVLDKEYRLVARDGKGKDTISKGVRCNPGFIQARKIVPVP